MSEDQIAQCITEFVDKHYPKRVSKDRGFALCVMSLFLNDLTDEDSKYKIIKK
jgi:hypothetical protein